MAPTDSRHRVISLQEPDEKNRVYGEGVALIRVAQESLSAQLE